MSFEVAKEMDIVENHKRKQEKKLQYHKKQIKKLKEHVKQLDRELNRLTKKL